MSRVAEPQVAVDVAELARSEQPFVLTGVDWQTYVRLLEVLGDRPVRVTFDRGTLEFMTLSRKHELCNWLLGHLLEVWAEELGLPLAVGGAMTFQREDLQRGLEGDGCYWIANEALVRGKENIDLSLDPPPDLALEVDISRSSLNRLPLYAALRVPEVWRYDGTTVQVGLLQPDGQYQWGDRSACFPTLPVAELNRFLLMRNTMDHLGVVRAFRAWVRQYIAAQPS